MAQIERWLIGIKIWILHNHAKTEGRKTGLYALLPSVARNKCMSHQWTWVGHPELVKQASGSLASCRTVLWSWPNKSVQHDGQLFSAEEVSLYQVMSDWWCRRVADRSPFLTTQLDHSNCYCVVCPTFWPRITAYPEYSSIRCYRYIISGPWYSSTQRAAVVIHTPTFCVQDRIQVLYRASGLLSTCWHQGGWKHKQVLQIKDSHYFSRLCSLIFLVMF